MVQIIEENRKPSFSDRLMLGLGKAAQEGAVAIPEMMMQKERNKILNEKFGKEFSSMTPEMQQEIVKSQSKRGLYSELFGGSKEGKGLGEEFKGLSPQQETILALEDPKAFTAYQHLKQSHEKQQEEVKKKENLESTLGEMMNTLLEGRLGYTGKRFSSKGRRDVQYFDTLGTQLESIGKDMVSKGVLSAPRFAYLLGNLPSSGKTDAGNAGAIEAWARELNLEIPGIEKLETLYKEPSETKKVKPGTQIDLETLEKIYKKTGGDKEKAKAVAKKMGYNVE